MAIKLTNTAQAALDNGLKILVHGPAGIGKTTLTVTTGGNPLIISTEKGLLALRGHSVPVIEATTWQDLIDAYNFVATAPEAAAFDWIILDSLSDMAQLCLAAEKAKAADPRQAYGALADKVFDLIRRFRDLPGKNILFIAQQGREKDEQTNATLYAPLLPGRTVGQGAPFQMDEVFAMRQIATADGQLVRAFQTQRDLQFEAKDRSGCLEVFEPANLAHIAQKIRAGVRRAIPSDTGPIVPMPPRDVAPADSAPQQVAA